MLCNLKRPCLAGSTSQPLTTNGWLSAAASPTGGRYGSVTIEFPLPLNSPCCVLVLKARSVDLLPLAFHRSLEHYSFLCHSERLVPNQLSSGYLDPCLLLTRALTGHNLKLWMVFAIVGTLSYALPFQRREAYHLIVVIIFPALLMHVFDCRIPFDRYSHVRLYLQFHITTTFLNRALTNVPSIAIWNRDKVAVALAVALWGVNIGFHLRSKSLSLTSSTEDLVFDTNVVW